MPVADLVIRGTVRTVDDAQPTAEALAVADWRIVAVGIRADVDTWIGPGTRTLDLGDGSWLNGEAPDTPLVIIQNSGHKAFFNTATRPAVG
jgi:predicted amidohydrolase YtcJ